MTRIDSKTLVIAVLPASAIASTSMVVDKAIGKIELRLSDLLREWVRFDAQDVRQPSGGVLHELETDKEVSRLAFVEGVAVLNANQLRNAGSAFLLRIPGRCEVRLFFDVNIQEQ